MPSVMGGREPPVSRVVAKTKSDQAQRNANRLTVTIALRLTGRTTDRKVRNRPAPSIAAAFISSSGMPDIFKRRVMIAAAGPSPRVPWLLDGRGGGTLSGRQCVLR